MLERGALFGWPSLLLLAVPDGSRFPPPRVKRWPRPSPGGTPSGAAEVRVHLLLLGRAGPGPRNGDSGSGDQAAGNAPAGVQVGPEEENQFALPLPLIVFLFVLELPFFNGLK